MRSERRVMLVLDVEAFWRRVDDCLLKRGLELQDMADAVRIPYGTLIGWRYRGRLPKLEEFAQICQWLHVSMDYLATGAEAEPLSDEAVSVEYSDKMKLVVRLMEQDPSLLEIICSVVESVEKTAKKIG